MWIESHADLGDHPKVKELCFHLGIKKHEAIGHLHLLWHFALKYAWRDGDLRRFSPRVICEAMGWDKDHETFLRALREAGWLEPDSLQIHDWLDYAGKLVKDRLYNEKRRITSSNDVVPRKSPATLPNLTLPNREDRDLRHLAPNGAVPLIADPTPEKLMALWNAAAHPNLPRVKDLTEKRRRHVRARLAEHPEHPFWKDVLDRINRSRFLTGQSGDWKATFDWVINPTNLVKIKEGNYDNR